MPIPVNSCVVGKEKKREQNYVKTFCTEIQRTKSSQGKLKEKKRLKNLHYLRLKWAGRGAGGGVVVVAEMVEGLSSKGEFKAQFHKKV
jgi:hypothetical protein